MSAENVQLIRDQLAALNRGDWAETERGVHPEIEWVVAREHPAARTVRGLTELRAYREDWRDNLGDLHFDPDELLDRGDRVIAVGTIRGTGAGSGADVEVPIAFVYWFRDGLIVRVEEFLDPKEALDS